MRAFMKLLGLLTPSELLDCFGESVDLSCTLKSSNLKDRKAELPRRCLHGFRLDAYSRRRFRLEAIRKGICNRMANDVFVFRAQELLQAGCVHDRIGRHIR